MVYTGLIIFIINVEDDDDAEVTEKRNSQNPHDSISINAAGGSGNLETGRTQEPKVRLRRSAASGSRKGERDEGIGQRHRLRDEMKIQFV